MNTRSLSDHLERIFTILNAENRYRNGLTVEIESDLTLAELFALFHTLDANEEDMEIAPEHLVALIEFLAHRWDRIRNSNLAYPHQPHSTVNVICLLLAQELEKLTGVSRYRLLMPTITVDCNEISTTEIKENNLELHEFVLSDDNDRIIDIIPCMDFAVEDGVLKHTSLFAGKTKALSKTEADRVIHHSEYAQNYYTAIIERVDAKTKSNSFGSTLSGLCESLRRGGNHGTYRGGEELNAGHNANEGIFYFSEWLAALTESERKNLLSRKRADGNKTFADIWGRAARPTDADYKSTNFCVALIADDVELILKNNRDLFDIYPQNKQVAKLSFLAPLDENVANAKKELMRAMRSNRYHVTASYDDEQNREYNKRFKDELPHYFADYLDALRKLKNELHTCFFHRFKAHILSTVHNHSELLTLLIMLPEKYHGELINTLGDSLNDILTSDTLPLVENKLSQDNIKILHQYCQPEKQPEYDFVIMNNDNHSSSINELGIFSFINKLKFAEQNTPQENREQPHSPRRLN